MSVKVILFDVDGVLLRVPHYFSKQLEKVGYKDAVTIMNTFYKGEHIDCAEGRMDSKKAIQPYLEKIGWNITAEQYFAAQLAFEKQYFDTSFVALVKRLQNSGIYCYLGTDQEEWRAKMLLEDLDFGNIFDGNFMSYSIGYRKCHDEFWETVISTLPQKISSLEPHEIVFFDDVQNNVDMAKKYGIRAFLFTDMPQFYTDMKEIGIMTRV